MPDLTATLQDSSNISKLFFYFPIPRLDLMILTKNPPSNISEPFLRPKEQPRPAPQSPSFPTPTKASAHK